VTTRDKHLGDRATRAAWVRIVSEAIECLAIRYADYVPSLRSSKRSTSQTKSTRRMPHAGLQAVLDSFRALPADDRRDFFQSIAGEIPAESALVLFGNMPLSERERFVQKIIEEVNGVMMPAMLITALHFIQGQPELAGKSLEKLVAKQHVEALVDMSLKVSQLYKTFEAARLKATRDRKSAPATVRRNVEICDLRKRDRKLWSQGKLAKRFKISPPAIRKILTDEEKWRRLAAEQDRGEPTS
jgi:hypothetical protein